MKLQVDRNVKSNGYMAIRQLAILIMILEELTFMAREDLDY